MLMPSDDALSARQDSSVTTQYEAWASIYDLLWRRYVNKTLPVLKRALDLVPGERMLDLGCGTGELERLILTDTADVQLIGVDIAPSMIERARGKLAHEEGVRFEQADAHDLPFEDASFDVIACGNTFHYVSHPEVVAQEAARVLRPGGRLVLLDWCRDFWTCRVMDAVLRRLDPAYHTCYTLDELADFLAPTAFSLHEAFRYRFDLVWGMMVVEAGLAAEQ